MSWRMGRGGRRGKPAVGAHRRGEPAAWARRRAAVGLWALLLATAPSIAQPAGAGAEQASQPGSAAAGQLDAGKNHGCAVVGGGSVRCWGYGGDGELGYGSKDSVGDDEVPASVGPVDLGPGRTATALSAGDYHTCALLDDASVRCWGFGGNGRLGYNSTTSVGDTQTPGSTGTVDLGRHTVKAISAGGGHTCALLDDNSVRCWGYGFEGQLGYGNASNVGDGAGLSPAAVGPVDLGGHTARAISAGDLYTCALLDDATVRCWGFGSNGQLGYGSTSNVGDGAGSDLSPASVGAVDLGGHRATAISAGGAHTCAVLDDGHVRCWGFGGNGDLGYGMTRNVGDTSTPGSAGPVDLGSHAARAISAGSAHTCALLDDASVRCWGYGGNGRLGYGNTHTVGDTPTPTPGSAPVDLGPGRSAVAISAGGSHTCARLDDGHVRCWGYGGNGRLGYCNEDNVGDVQTPGSAGPVSLAPGDGGVGCAAPGPAPGTGGGPGAGQAPGPATVVAQSPSAVDPLAVQAQRLGDLRACLARAASRASKKSRSQRTRERRACLSRYGRTPGRVVGLSARAPSRSQVLLSFVASGSDGVSQPAARAYRVKQSSRRIRGAHDFARARSLCHSRCAFSVSTVGAPIRLTVTGLRPRRTYYYAVAALDNVSGRRGPPSATVRVRTR